MQRHAPLAKVCCNPHSAALKTLSAPSPTAGVTLSPEWYVPHS